MNAQPSVATPAGKRAISIQIVLAIVGSQALAWFLIIVARLAANVFGSSSLPVGQIWAAAVLIVVAGAWWLLRRMRIMS